MTAPHQTTSQPDVTLENLTFRPPRMDELPAVVELSQAYSISQVGIPLEDESDYRETWEDPLFNLETNARVFVTPEGRIVGYAHLDPAHHFATIFADGCVHPDFQGRGIGSALMNWIVANAHLWLYKAPADAQVVVRGGLISTDTTGRTLYEEAGFHHSRSFQELKITFDGEPEQPVWPEGIIVRTFNPATESHALAAAHQEAFADHWGAVPMSVEQYYEAWKQRMESGNFAPENWFIAWDGDQIAAFTQNRPTMPEDPNMAWVDALGVRAAWRKRGLGLAILLHTFNVFYERGKKGVGLGVDADSITGATRLYARAGMIPQLRFDAMEKTIRPGKDLSKRS